MKLTKLSAAPTLAPQAALSRTCRLMPAPVNGMDAGTASQLIPGVRQTSRGSAQRVGYGARAHASVAWLSSLPPAAHAHTVSAARHGAGKGDARGWPGGAFGRLGRLGIALLTASSARLDANGEAEQTRVGLSPQRNFGHTAVVARSVVPLKTSRRHTLSNKGMKLTSVEHIGRSQLIPGVRQTSRGPAQRVGYGARAHASVALLSLLPPAAHGYRVSTGAARCAQEDATRGGWPHGVSGAGQSRLCALDGFNGARAPMARQSRPTLGFPRYATSGTPRWWRGRSCNSSAGRRHTLSNKGMKLTKPSVLELRSLSPVFGGQRRVEA